MGGSNIGISCVCYMSIRSRVTGFWNLHIQRASMYRLFYKKTALWNAWAFSWKGIPYGIHVLGIFMIWLVPLTGNYRWYLCIHFSAKASFLWVAHHGLILHLLLSNSILGLQIILISVLIATASTNPLAWTWLHRQVLQCSRWFEQWRRRLHLALLKSVVGNVSLSLVDIRIWMDATGVEKIRKRREARIRAHGIGWKIRHLWWYLCRAAIGIHTH